MDFSLIYGPPYWYKKEAIWKKLQKICDRFQGPWVILGDFNALSNPGDKGRSALSFILHKWPIRTSSYAQFVRILTLLATLSHGLMGGMEGKLSLNAWTKARLLGIGEFFSSVR